MKTNLFKKCLKSILACCMAISIGTWQVQAESNDVKLDIQSISATSEYSSNPISLANDGQSSTFWESNWSGSNYTPSESNPIIVTAQLGQMQWVSTIRITPRQGNDLQGSGDGNGRFLKARYTYLDASGNAIGESFEQTYSNPPSADDIVLEVNNNIAGLKIEILSAYASTATMAELAFYQDPDTAPATEEVELSVQSITANSEHANNPITKAIDGSASTFWETNWAAANHSPTESNPMIVTALLAENDKVSEIRITPRQGTNLTNGDGNGRFLKARYTYLDASGNPIGESFEQTYSSPPSADDIVLSVNQTIGGIKIEVLSAYAAGSDVTATMAEIKFIKRVEVELETAALEAKIEEAINLDITNKSSASINALYEVIDQAKEVLNNARNQNEIDQMVDELSEAMVLEDESFTEEIHISSTKDLPRESNFNSGWLFRETTTDSYETLLDESQFKSINLPHDFSIDNDFTTSGEAESGYLLGGTGWYRKHVVLPASANGKQISLNFDGSYMDTYIYVNGEFVAEHHNGYSQFTVDLTDKLIADGTTDNVIAVKVVNTVPSSRWYSGSGIYRDVTLFVKEATHIKQDGLFVHSENVSTNSATVIVENEIENPQGEVVTTIYDKDGNEIATNTVNASANTSQTFTISNPDLWSVNTYTPALYTLKSEIKVNGEVVDAFSDQFGIKSITFDVNTGFYLNGQSIKLKGVCQHHDQGALGAVANYYATYRQVKILKDMGCNSIRVTHNPASEVLLDICDELGMLVINEMFDGLYQPKNGNRNDFSKWFNSSVDTNLMGATANMTWAEYAARQSVRMSRNHASIILYSVGNEVQEGSQGYDCSGYPEKIREICTWMQDEDPYTKPTVGSNWLKSGDSIALAYSQIIAEEFNGPIGMNYASTSQMQSIRNSHPTWVLYGSETSSAHHSRDVYYTQGQDNTNQVTTDYENDSSKASWGLSASAAWKVATETNWNMGEYVWTGFDYLGEPTPWNNTNAGGSFPAARSSTFGIIETTGLWKDIAYLYHSFWNEEERTLHVTDSWTANMGSTVLMQVFSDADKVELYLNGTLKGSDTSTVQSNGNRYFSNSKFFAEFNVPYAAGTIEVKAYDLVDGNYVEVTDTVGVKKVTTPGSASTLTLTSDKTTINSDGYELAYIEIDVVDNQGNICSEYNDNLTIQVEGNGNLVGVDSGKQSEMQSYRIDNPKSHTKKAFNGKLVAIVQSTKKAGAINVTVSGSGLTSQSIMINAEAQSDSTDLVSVEYVSKYALFENETLELPSTVSAILENGETVEKAIIWNTDNVNLTTAGVYTAIGTFEDSDVTLSATISVYKQVAAAENYSMVYHEGSLFELPSETVVYYKDGTKAGTFPIQWKYYDETEFVAGTTETIEGIVKVASQTMTMQAKVRVVEPLKEAENFARSSSDVPTLSQSCTNIADSLASINNGTYNNSSSTSERWTDWNEQNNQVVWVQYVWNNQHTIGSLEAYIWQDSTSTCAEPKEIDYSIQYRNENGEWVDAEMTYITASPYYDDKTTFSLLEPVTTNGIRLTMDKRRTGLFTGLTELRVMEYVAHEPSETNASMSSITIDDNVIDTTSGTEFDVTGDSEVLNAVVEQVSIADSATYVVLRDDTTGILRIVVRAEDGTNQTYAFTLEEPLPQVDKTPLEEKIAEALTIEADGYTEDSYNALQTAITNAQNALTTLTTQDEVSAEVSKLQQAIDALQLLPLKVTNVVATATNYKTIQLTWDAQENESYEVYRQNTKTGEWILLNVTNEATFTITGVKTGKEYSYKVVATKTIGDTTYKAEESDVVTAKAMLQGEVELTLENEGQTKFVLNWTQVEGATRYIIYRKSSTTEYKKILTLGKDATTYTSQSMMPDTYTYIVKAARYDGSERVMTNGSNEVIGLSGCEAPTITLNKTSDTSIQVSWNAVEGMKYYEIYRANEDGMYRRLKVTNETSFENKSLKAGTYYYKVKAYRVYNGIKAYTAFSNEESMTLQ